MKACQGKQAHQLKSRNPSGSDQHVIQYDHPAFLDSWLWVEFVVGSFPCSEGFFSGFSGFPLSSKTNISKFQFDLESEGNRFVSRQTVKCHPR